MPKMDHVVSARMLGAYARRAVHVLLKELRVPLHSPLQQLLMPSLLGELPSPMVPRAVLPAHFDTSRCPPKAAPPLVSSSQSQLCSRAHLGTSRCPFRAAANHVANSHRQSCSRTHCNMSRRPASAAPKRRATHSTGNGAPEATSSLLGAHPQRRVLNSPPLGPRGCLLTGCHAPAPTAAPPSVPPARSGESPTSTRPNHSRAPTPTATPRGARPSALMGPRTVHASLRLSCSRSHVNTSSERPTRRVHNISATPDHDRCPPPPGSRDPAPTLARLAARPQRPTQSLPKPLQHLLVPAPRDERTTVQLRVPVDHSLPWATVLPRPHQDPQVPGLVRFSTSRFPPWAAARIATTHGQPFAQTQARS